MIFLTVGGQLPFDRLVDAVDEIAPKIGEAIFGQIGKTELVPKNFEAVNFLKPDEFKSNFSKARLVIGHAGIGTILSAIELQKPMILMARRAAMGEHRNDHQLATVEQLGQIKGVHVVETADEIHELLTKADLALPEKGASPNRNQLVDYLRAEVEGLSAVTKVS